MSKKFYLFLGLLSLSLTLALTGCVIAVPESLVTPAKIDYSYMPLAYGVPGPADTIVKREWYALGYIEKDEQPSWVSYNLTGEHLRQHVATRGDDFRIDPAIPTGSATLEDYKRSGYDRGHLAPAADFCYNKKAMSESFFMSNMSPQKPSFNRGIWKDLETWVRSTAQKEQSIIVVTGPVLTKPTGKTIGKNKVTVPGYYYKVIYDVTPPEKMIGFILPNENRKAPLASFAVSVDQVEEATGLDFFANVPQIKQKRLESECNPNAWAW